MEGRDHAGVVWWVTAGGPADAASNLQARCEAAVGVEAVVRFELAEGFELPHGATHAVVCETAEADVAGVAKALRNTTRRGTSGDHGIEEATAYRVLSQLGESEGRRMNGVVAVFTDCAEPDEEEAFNVWYEEHARYVVDHLGHYAVTRYVCADPASNAPRYLAIYETENEDPGQLQRDGWKAYFEAEHTEEHATPGSLVLRGEVALEPRR